ncbi:hypothetical protein [Microbispora sp. CA-102843]|uniref:hypothetical protein n=1 Tax=Microbispora sp. CA-102843 TaxID=3239952 RepID=UPI003D9210AF
MIRSVDAHAHLRNRAGDWPLAELGAGPVEWRGAVDELIGELSPAARQTIMSGTASAHYRLGA